MSDHDSLTNLLRNLQPQLTRLFERFRLPSSVAERLLEDTMMVLVYRYEELARPDLWLVRTLRVNCLRYRREQRRRLCRAVDIEIRDWLEDASVTSDERAARRRQLSSQIDDLPWRCRLLLRRAYRLPEVLGERAPKTVATTASQLFGPFRAEDPQIRCLSQLMKTLVNPQPLASDRL